MKHLTLTLLALTVFLLSSCGETPPEIPQNNENRSTVFSEQILSLPEDWTVTNFPALTFDGERLSVDVWRETTEDHDGNG